MRNLLTIILAVVSVISAGADKYTYTFRDTPISEAIVRISKEHPDVNISFIYKELDNYRTSSKINTDNPYDALRQTVGLNPITVVKKEDAYYVEALQHGRFRYTGRTVSSDGEPVVAATVMLLAPADSTVITYGITDNYGRFSIPCDRQGVIAKLTSVGYRPTFHKCSSFAVGTVVMKELPVQLRSVKVEGNDALLYADKSIYRPTQRQKNASQTATDLLVRMAIPQLDARLGSSSVSTVTGQPVAIYIDGVPATTDDLKMMRMEDVKTVEYLENPSDSRFQGNKHVVNFRMVQYELGGYVKALATEDFIVNSGLLQANARLVKGKMTYDIMGYGFYMANNHFGTDRTESFRLPQSDGTIKSFDRVSKTESSKLRTHNYHASIRALYNSNRITANSQVSLGLGSTPHNDEKGSVSYTDDILRESSYFSSAESDEKYLNYSGFYHFDLSHNNSLTSSLNYSYSHTRQQSLFRELGIPEIANSAFDNTHNGNIRINYAQSFSQKHSLNAFVRGAYEHNRTNYGGSVEALDLSTMRYLQTGASYSFTTQKVRGSLGFGWDWIETRLNDNKAFSQFPYLDFSLAFSPDTRNSFDLIFHYSVWPPSSNYKSDNLIQVSPFLWHTGNPILKSHRSYDFGLFYTFIASNRFNITPFASAWLVRNRPAFVYEGRPDGIVRTIQQPIGSFGDYTVGISMTVNLLGRSLQLKGKIEQHFVHNGKPYNVNHSFLSYYLQALYYVGSFNFAVSYQSPKGSHNYDCMSGIWTRLKDSFLIQAGWSNASWNIRLTAQNLQRWNWRSYRDTMNSEYYSVNRWTSNASSHAHIQLSATYTFGFGKKIRQGNDLSRQGGASSGILK